MQSDLPHASVRIVQLPWGVRYAGDSHIWSSLPVGGVDGNRSERRLFALLDIVGSSISARRRFHPFDNAYIGTKRSWFNVSGA